MSPKQKTVLLIEDNQEMVNLYKHKFELEGFKVLTADDGAEGINILKEAKPQPDLVLLDIMLPKMSGYEVLQKIKADPKTKNTPVIILTILMSGPIKPEELKKMGAYQYLIKSSVTPKEVVQNVKSALKIK